MAFKKGQSGNPSGRKVGSKNKQKLLADHIDAFSKKMGNIDTVQVLVEKLITQSFGGCLVSQKILIERLIPVIKQTTLPVQIDVPKGSDALKTADLVVNEMLNGQLSPDVGKQILDSLSVTMNIEQSVELHIPAQREHPFWFNVNTYSGSM